MKITLTDLNVIVDTLLGSRRVSDCGNLWKHSHETRGEVAEKLLNGMQSIEVEIEVKGE